MTTLCLLKLDRLFILVALNWALIVLILFVLTGAIRQEIAIMNVYSVAIYMHERFDVKVI